MLILRAIFIDFLLCVHVLGAAVLFRRFFPRESPWWAFVVPILVLLSALNFIEHYIALPNLGWLLPLTLGGSLWTIFRPGYSWVGLRLPGILFVIMFSFVLFLKCLSPDIVNYTESAGDMTRILNYSLGGTLPPIDCWLPPYDYGGYYSFQQYGASILKRLFYLDLGTSCNVAYAFLLAWTCLIGAGVAHSISGKTWIALVTVIVLQAGSTGSVPFLFYYGHGNDYALSTSLNTAWDDPSRNPFTWICAHDKYHPVLTLVSPMYSFWWNEFHATLGGAFMTMAALLSCSEVCKTRQSDWPWVGLVVVPVAALITSAWFFPILVFFCAGSGALALMTGRRPRSVKFTCIAAGVGLVFIWPSVYSLLGNSGATPFSWTRPEDHTPLWMFALQWWPICLPWIGLCFVWSKLDLMARWIHAAIPILLLTVEFVTFGNRSLTTEKMWGELYGTGLVTLFPLVFMQRKASFFVLSGILLLFSGFCFGMWMKYVYYDPIDGHNFCRLQGDFYIQADSQTRRLVQVLSRLHGATILPGKSYWAYNEAPTIIGFSENRCYVAYTYQEGQCGHGEEANYRSNVNNSFYSGAMTNPLPFLRANNIAAVLIWPEDAIPDTLLTQFKMELGPEFVYVDCKADEPHNAGVFMRQTPLTAARVSVSPSNLNPPPSP